MSKYYIIRHGQSQHNCGKTDSLDSPLTENGVVQARTVGKFLARTVEDINEFVIYTSPLLRCLMTTEQIVEGSKGVLSNSRVKVRPLIHESLPPDSRLVHIPVRSDQFPNFDWSLMSQTFTIGPDDGRKLINRSDRAIQESYEKSILVSHGSTCMALAICASQQEKKMRDWDHSISNASITFVENGDIRWWGRVLKFDDYCSANQHVEYVESFS